MRTARADARAVLMKQAIFLHISGIWIVEKAETEIQKRGTGMDNTTRFDGKGELYAKARPGYAPELFYHIKDTLLSSDGSVFADIGSGTGIFSEQLLKIGHRVYAVEPNGDMRKKAEEKLCGYDGFTSVDGIDSNTTLPDQSVDCITVAQAFHWFDAEAFKKECQRILKPNGKVIIVYNTRDVSAECNKALADLHRIYCPAFRGFSNGMKDETCRGFFDGKCNVFHADNSQTYDRRGYIGRALSSSYSLCEGDEKFAEYLAELDRLFDRFSNNGTLIVPMQTVAYIGTV